MPGQEPQSKKVKLTEDGDEAAGLNVNLVPERVWLQTHSVCEGERCDGFLAVCLFGCVFVCFRFEELFDFGFVCLRLVPTASLEMAIAVVFFSFFLSLSFSRQGPVNIVVAVPEVPGTKWPLHGQTLRIQALYTDSIQSLKEKVAASLGGMQSDAMRFLLLFLFFFVPVLVSVFGFCFFGFGFRFGFVYCIFLLFSYYSLVILFLFSNYSLFSFYYSLILIFLFFADFDVTPWMLHFCCFVSFTFSLCALFAPL
jgi:hypothetical protein